jgi:trigger factor
LEAIARAENIAATEAEIEAEIDKMAKVLRQEPAAVRKNLGDLSILKYDIMIKKAIDFLVEHSVTVPPRTGGDTATTGATAAEAAETTAMTATDAKEDEAAPAEG